MCCSFPNLLQTKSLTLTLHKTTTPNLIALTCARARTLQNITVITLEFTNVLVGITTWS